MSVESIAREHWAKYGRNYYARYDYEGVDKKAAEKMLALLSLPPDVSIPREPCLVDYGETVIFSFGNNGFSRLQITT